MNQYRFRTPIPGSIVNSPPYGWYIHTVRGRRVNIFGPYNLDPYHRKLLGNNAGRLFRMLRDGRPYITGRLRDETATFKRLGFYALMPLVDFGEARGCTDIEYCHPTKGGTIWFNPGIRSSESLYVQTTSRR